MFIVTFKRIICFLSLFIGSLFLEAQSFDYSIIGNEHPRLLLKAGGEEKLIKALQQFPELQNVHRKIIAYCDNILIAPTQHYHKDAKRLSVASTSSHHLLYLSYAYRMIKDKKYSIRAEQEMRALCSFPNWNPGHFLDTSTSALALGISYDWLFHKLTDETKAMTRKAIVEKGFESSRKPPGDWFYTLDTNWNSVCNAELVYAALAIYEDEPEEAKAIIEKCMETIHKPLEAYGPDGAYSEGYTYWQYGTGLQMLLHALLESVFGTDNGLSEVPGFMESAYDMLHMVGPSGLCFNYSDCANSLPNCVFPLFWFSKKTNDSSLLWWEKVRFKNGRISMERYLPLYLTQIVDANWENPTVPKQKMWTGKGVTPIVLVRTSWDEQALFFGAKGGTLKHSHAHMDNGSFVFDTLGVRWAMDFGLQSYQSLESMNVDLFNPAQDAQRWDIIRMNNWHHNTLTVNGNRHNADSHAAIVKIFDKDSKRGARIDLNETFKYDLKSTVRDVALIQNKYLEIVDVITASDKPADVQWNMCTPASAKIVGLNTVILTQKGKTLHLIVDNPKKIDLKIWTNDPEHDYDAPNPGTLRVGFVTNLNPGEKVKLKVRLVPK